MAGLRDIEGYIGAEISLGLLILETIDGSNLKKIPWDTYTDEGYTLAGTVVVPGGSNININFATVPVNILDPGGPQMKDREDMTISGGDSLTLAVGSYCFVVFAIKSGGETKAFGQAKLTILETKVAIAQ